MKLLKVLAVLAAALVTGVFFDTFAASSARASMAASAFVRYQQTIHTTYVKMMPILLGIAILSAAAWIILDQTIRHTSAFWLLLGSILLLLCIGLLTTVVNRPINNELMTWNPASPPADLTQIWAPWEFVNTLRAILGASVIVLEVLVLCVAPRSATSAQN